MALLQPSNLCCIVIPIYKEDLTITEKISLKRLEEVLWKDKTFLSDYEVCFVYPECMNISKYKKIYKHPFKELTFDKKYFESTDSYSQLLISYDFYNKVKYVTYAPSRYMLIYQLDCYIFEDKIKDWCLKWYDYIGAPIFSENARWNVFKVINGKKTFVPAVGNGGFSLRNIDTFLELTNPHGELAKAYDITPEKTKDVKFEDLYFIDTLGKLYDLNIPDWKEAVNFSIDMNPEVPYNYWKIDPHPMAIHAFEKNIRFWKDRIPELNNKKVIDYCEDKYKEFFKYYYQKPNEK